MTMRLPLYAIQKFFVPDPVISSPLIKPSEIPQYRYVIRDFQIPERKSFTKQEIKDLNRDIKRLSQGTYLPDFKDEREKEEFYSLLKKANLPLPKLDKELEREKQLRELFQRNNMNFPPEERYSNNPAKEEPKEIDINIVLSYNPDTRLYETIVTALDASYRLAPCNSIQGARIDLELLVRKQGRKVINMKGSDEYSTHVIMKITGYGTEDISIKGVKEEWISSFDPKKTLDSYFKKTKTTEPTELNEEEIKEKELKRKIARSKTLEAIANLRKKRDARKSMADIVDGNRGEGNGFYTAVKRARKKKL